MDDELHITHNNILLGEPDHTIACAAAQKVFADAGCTPSQAAWSAFMQETPWTGPVRGSDGRIVEHSDYSFNHVWAEAWRWAPDAVAKALQLNASEVSVSLRAAVKANPIRQLNYARDFDLSPVEWVDRVVHHIRVELKNQLSFDLLDKWAWALHAQHAEQRPEVAAEAAWATDGEGLIEAGAREMEMWMAQENLRFD